MAHKNGLLAAFVERSRKMRFETQTHDEEVILLLRRHWFTNLPWISLVLVMILVPLFVFKLNLLGQTDAISSIPLRFQLVGSLIWYIWKKD